MYDDPELVIKHVRSCFVRGDETGLCEAVLEKHRSTRRQSSPPIRVGNAKESDFEGPAKAVSNLAVRIADTHLADALPPSLLDEPAIESYKNGVPEKSSLGDALAASSSNPFHKFSKFSAKVRLGSGVEANAPGVAVKQLTIYVYLKGRDATGPPIHIAANLSMAPRIVDLAGLICWQYIVEVRQPPLTDLDLSQYAVLSADEGEVDFAMPSCDMLEPLAKYGFTCMALVHCSVFATGTKAKRLSSNTFFVTVTISHQKFGQREITVPNKDISLIELVRRYLRMVADQAANNMVDQADQFVLEPTAKLGHLIRDLDLPLSKQLCHSFNLYRKFTNPFSASGEVVQNGGSVKRSSSSLADQQALKIKQVFKVSIERSRVKTVLVDLVVDNDTILFKQMGQKTSKSLPAMIPRSAVDNCSVISADAAGSGRTHVRLQLQYFDPGDTKRSQVKKLTLELSEQKSALELVSLLR